MRALVTGASGHIGANIVRELLAQGHEPVALVRRTSDTRGLAGLAVELVQGDILDPASLDAAMRGVEVVHHAAANFAVWSKRREDVLRPALEGTGNVFAAAARAGVRRIVHTSSSAAVGFSRSPSELRSEKDFRETSHLAYYEAKTAGEKLAYELAREHGVPVVVTCPTLVLGSFDYRVTPSMRPVLDMANGRGPTTEGGTSIVSARDVARAHLLAAERGRPGERYIIGGENLTLKQIGALVATWTGRTPKHVALPRWAFLTVAALQEAGAALTGRAPALTRAAVRDVIGQYAWYDVTKAERELGFAATPPAEVIDETMRWFLDAGWLAPAVAERVQSHPRAPAETERATAVA
ncbi:MAG: NAD-dependent epimerase/dehydratase family protein [Myxococcales bacterium]|nr:NAD-dependent epimerase/dehydratase family protein [Myxococcales bacterium]